MIKIVRTDSDHQDFVRLVKHLDADLAELYGVETKRINEQVKRNLERFPADFMFQLTDQELASLRSQFAASKIPILRRLIGT